MNNLDTDFNDPFEDLVKPKYDTKLYSEESIYFLEKLDVAEASFSNRKGPYIKWFDEYEDDSVLRLQDWNLANGIPTLTAGLNDFGEGGIACLAGDPNHGKSSFMTNMMLKGLKNNPDLIIIDISLDDPLTKRYQQYLACLTGFAYQDISCPADLPEWKQVKLQEAKELVRQYYKDERLRTYEVIEKLNRSGTIKSYSMREFSNIFATMAEIRTKYPKHKIVMFIDAWNNLCFEAMKGKEELGSVEEYLQRLKSESESWKVGVFLSAHFRKVDGRKQTIEDIKGTTGMAYTAVWAGLLFNEFKRDPGDNPMMYVGESESVWPLIRLEQVKNKSSTWEMPLWYGLQSGRNQVIPVTPAEYKQYRQMYLEREQNRKRRN